MGEFFIYSLKVSLCLIGFYLLWKLLLSRDTFHRFNRMLLLAVVALSLLLPCVSIETETASPISGGMVMIENLVVSATVADDVSSSITPVQVLFLIYMLGVVFFLLLETFSLISLYRLIRRAPVAGSDEGCTICVMNEDIAPFSWFRHIVISRSDYDSNRRDILNHEKAHARLMHSVDVLLCNLLIIFQWFNPAAWLLKRELQDIHEYEADEAVLASGADASSYQLLLIRKAVGERMFAMANNLNHNSLKKRITMMKTKKSNPWARAKSGLVLTFAAVAVVAFANQEVKEISSGIKSESNAAVAEVVESMTVVTEAVPAVAPSEPALQAPKAEVARPDNDEVLSVAEEMPQFPGGMKALSAYLSENIKYPEEAREQGLGGRVIVTFVVEKDGTISEAKAVRKVSPALDAEAERVIMSMPKWNPGKLKGKAVRVKYTVPIIFSAQKPATALKIKDADDVDEKDAAMQIGKTMLGTNAPLCILNGKEVSKEEIDKLSPETIKQVNVIKDKSAVEKYGEKAAAGVIEIVLK